MSTYDSVAVQEAVNALNEALVETRGDVEESLRPLLAQVWEDGRIAEASYHRGSYREGNPYCKPTEDQT